MAYFAPVMRMFHVGAELKMSLGELRELNEGASG